MKFDLKAKIELSKKTNKKIVSDVKDWIKGFDKKIGEEARASLSSAKKDFLNVRIKSESHKRPHFILLRLKNALSKAIGKKHKVGVRGLKIKNYTIEFKVDKKPKKKFEIPLVKKISFKGKNVKLRIDPSIDIDLIEKGGVDRIINLVEEKIQKQYWGGKDEHAEELWRSKKKQPVWEKDPTKEMVDKRWIERFGRGVWLHTPTSTRILRAFEEIVMEEIIEKFGFQEMILPKTIPLEVWLKTGHIPGVAPSIYYLYQAKSVDPKDWEDFSDYCKITLQAPEKLLDDKLEGPIGGMCFAQCIPFYWHFRGKKIDPKNFPIKIWDASGTSHRWEAGGLHGIDRDSEFHRVELVWMGAPDQVKKIKEKLVKAYKHVFQNILDLEWRTKKVTPWYAAQAGDYEWEEGSKGTIDFEAWLPFKGGREDSEWLEFQNITVAGTKFSDAWNFETMKGNEVWTGCSGVGLERWMAAFLAQKGLNPKKWPKKFREKVGKLPDTWSFA